MQRFILFLALSALFAFYANAQQSIVEKPIKSPVEIISLRTVNSETFDNQNGTRTMKVYSARKYYKDKETGKLNNISLSIVDEISDGYTRAVRSGEYTYRYNPDNKKKGYSFSRGSYYVKYIPHGDRTGITCITTPNENGVKEDIIFSSEASPKVSWKIFTNAKVSFSDGVLTFTDPNDIFLFKIPAAYAFDSKEKNIPVTATFTGDLLSYTLSIPGDAVWPITLDPSTIIIPGTDGTISRYANDIYPNIRDYISAGVYSASDLTIGQRYWPDNTSFYVYRSFAEFYIPDLTTVEACTLYVNGKSDYSNDNYNIYIHGASEFGPTLNGSDYLNFDGQQSGSAHTGTVLNDSWNSSSYSSNWNTIVFNAAGRDSVETAKGDTLRIALISQNDYNNSPPQNFEYVKFESSSHATDKPYISITYTPALELQNFSMTALDSTSIAVSWDYTGEGDSKFYIVNYADSSIVDSTTVNALADTLIGLDWDTQYIWSVTSDPSAATEVSFPDSAYTLTGPPSDVSFFDYTSSHLSMVFDNGHNPDSTDFTVRIVINSDTLYWNDSLNDTTSVEYKKTAAAWGDTINIGENGFLEADTVYTIGINGQNSEDVWTETWYYVKTSEEPAQIIINLTGSPDTLFEFKNSAGISDYNTARSITGNDSINVESLSPELGQIFDSSDYFLKRLGLEAVLPEGYEARAGSLYIYVTGDSSDTDFDVTAFNGGWNGDGYENEAFWNFDGRQPGSSPHNGTGLFDTFSTSGLNANNWYYWIYNKDGLNVLTTALGDTLRNTIVSSRDSSASAPSGNEFFTIAPDSTYLTFSIDLPDTLPGNFTLTSVAADSIFAEWIDRSHSEEQYQIVNCEDSTAVSDMLSSGTESTVIGGLDVNTYYRLMLKVLGGNLGGQYSEPDSTFTHANVPGKPSIYFAGGDVWDESGSGNHGTVTDVLFVKDERAAGDHAYDFNGTSSYITTSDTTDFDFTESFTLACRIKRTGADTTYNRAITYENSSEEASYRLMFNDNNQLFFQINNGSLVSTGFTPVLTENIWYSIAGTYDGECLRIFVDGDSTNVSAPALDDIELFTDRILSIGRSPSGASTYLNGYVDDVRIYNTALSSAQIDSLNNGYTMESIQSNLKLRYSFDFPDSLMIFTLDTNYNPSYTHYAIQDSISGYYIDATAEPESLSTLPLGEWGWRTFDEWGAALGDSLSGITPGNFYVLRAKARNGE